MKKLFLLLVPLLFFGSTGCATHYHKIQGNSLILYLEKPEASHVILACSLDGFEPREARKDGPRWVVVLPSGVSFRYYYVLDKRIFIPSCPMKEKDDFGSENCIYDPDP